MARLNLATLDPKEIRQLLFDTTRTLNLVVGIVRQHAKPEWTVRKKMEEALALYGSKVEPHFDRTLSAEIQEERDRRATARNRAFWAEVGDGRGGPDAPH